MGRLKKPLAFCGEMADCFEFFPKTVMVSAG
jgi:hypothetical protein